MYKVVADTNIYISAILFGGKPEKLLLNAGAGIIKLYTSPDILSEVLSVLKKKFKWNDYAICEVDSFIRDISFLVIPAHRIKRIDEDDPDNRILECAVETDADFIITGDKQHLLSLKEYSGIKLLTVGDFFKYFHGRGPG